MASQFALAARTAQRLSTIPGLASIFPKTTDDITAMTAAAKDTAKQAIDTIMAANPPTFENCAIATDSAQSEFSMACSAISVAKSTHTDKAVRDAASAALTELQGFSIDNFDLNRQLYQKFVDLQNTTDEISSMKAKSEKESCKISRDRLYWFDEELSDWKRAGMALPDDKLEEAKTLKKKVADLGIKFSRNVAEYKHEMQFTVEELAGVPENALNALKKVDGDDNKRIVGLDYPTYFAIMKNCEVASTRKTVMSAFENRAYPANLDLLKDIIATRHQLATLIGFDAYADLDLDSKMIKNPSNVRAFIGDLVPKLQKKWNVERETLLKDLHPSVVLDDKGNIPAWDITFMMNQYKKKYLNIDESKISEYFEVEASVAALFSIYEQFLSIEFVKHSAAEVGKHFWHETVEVLEVHSAPRNKENPRESLIGYMVLDLFPREGKYSHACCHSTVPTVRATDDDKGDNTKFSKPSLYSPAVAVLLANFPKSSSPDKPALFLHDDVVTLFHEAGHGLHTLLSRSTMTTFSGTRVKRDYVELPSQNLENWMWSPKILEANAKHYKTGEKLPLDLIDAKVKSKNAFSGRDMLRQMQFATYSLEIFAKDFASKPRDDLDVMKLFNDMRPGILPGLQYDDSGHFAANFEHLIGYGSCYVGYAWAQVLSQDVFEYIKERDGLLRAELGRRFVEHIIGPGGSRDPNELVREFLGREPRNDAFFKELGI